MTPQVNIEVIGARGSVVLEAVLDTGFDGDVCLSTPIAVTLGLELTGADWVEYADGRQERVLVFAGKVNFLGSMREVEIMLTDSVDTLIGTALLIGYTAFIDFDTGEVFIERKPGSAI